MSSSVCLLWNWLFNLKQAQSTHDSCSPTRQQLSSRCLGQKHLLTTANATMKLSLSWCWTLPDSRSFISVKFIIPLLTSLSICCHEEICFSLFLFCFCLAWKWFSRWSYMHRITYIWKKNLFMEVKQYDSEFNIGSLYMPAAGLWSTSTSKDVQRDTSEGEV